MSEYLIPAAATVIVAIIELLATRERRETKRHMDKVDARAKLRAEEGQLSMQMQDAALQLTIVTANALTGGHNNGNVEEARQAASAAQADYQRFLQRVTAREVAK